MGRSVNDSIWDSWQMAVVVALVLGVVFVMLDDRDEQYPSLNKNQIDKQCAAFVKGLVDLRHTEALRDPEVWESYDSPAAYGLSEVKSDYVECSLWLSGK
jgi:hypothetical protein